jgi:hypothetical protein
MSECPEKVTMRRPSRRLISFISVGVVQVSPGHEHRMIDQYSNIKIR